VSSIACNGSACSSGWYNGGVSVSLSALDGGSGVAAIRYTTDGSDPTVSSTLYTGPFSVPATATVKYRAWDNAGNVEPTNSQLIQIDTAPPASSISCNGSACSSGWYNAAVSVALQSSDSPSGVAQIRYATDGSDPTESSTLYTGPFSVSATATVKYRAWDNAGNVESTKSQLIQIDASAPASSISCNGSTCSSGWYNADVTVTLQATDGQSGVAQIRYTTDGTTPTLTTGSAYVGPFTIGASTTVRYRAWDSVGNAELTKSQLIQIETIAPTVALTSPTNGTVVTGNVAITASANDTGGSGVASVSFYLDGTILLSTEKGPKYTFQWNTKTTSKTQHTLTAIATDKAGNKTTSAPVTVTVR
jgi:hypothetical protein